MRPRADMLIVDDDPSVVAFLRESLADRGFDVETRLSAQEALELIEDRAFDLVITDLRLRGTSGLDLLQSIVRCRPTQRILAMSGFGNAQVASAAVSAGACDFIAKPFTIDALMEVVRLHVRRGEPLAPSAVALVACPSDRR